MTDRYARERTFQLIFGFIAMMAISSPQYAWALFTGPLEKTLGGSLAGLQITFTLLVVVQTFFSPFQAYLVERFGPRLLISMGAALSGLGWVLAAFAHTIVALYATYGVLCGLGTGIIYVGVIGLMVRWFPDRRGFAAGLAAAGYGAGALLTTFPISSMIAGSGYAHALIVFGLIQGVVGILAAQGLRMPPADFTPPVAVSARHTVRQTIRNFTPREMLRTPAFWLLFVMMTLMSTSGLMITSNIGAFAKEYGVATALVFGLAALPLSLSLSRITNGLTRPFFGWVSDRIGREPTMGIAFGFEAIAVLALMLSLHQPVLFVLLTGVAFFGWGEIFSLFPSMLTDLFGTKNATTNYGILYMAQGVGSLFGGPVAAWLRATAGSWVPVFAIVIGLDALCALLALFVLRRVRERMFALGAEPAILRGDAAPAV